LDVFIKFPLMHCLLRVDEFVSGNDVN
jgi:hypothetical protein